MKIAVTDACIFIDLCDLLLLAEFFRLSFEIHTTIEVFNELYPEQQRTLIHYVQRKKLFVYNLTDVERAEIRNVGYSPALSDADRSVIFVAGKLKAQLLSSDQVVRRTARQGDISCHGILWLFDCFIESEILTRNTAANKLNELCSINKMFNSNPKLAEEIRRRLALWTVR